MESYTNLNISRDAFIEWMLLVRFMLLQKWQYKLNGVGQTEIVVWKVKEKQTEQMIANRDKKWPQRNKIKSTRWQEKRKIECIQWKPKILQIDTPDGVLSTNGLPKKHRLQMILLLFCIDFLFITYPGIKIFRIALLWWNTKSIFVPQVSAWFWHLLHINNFEISSKIQNNLFANANKWMSESVSMFQNSSFAWKLFAWMRRLTHHQYKTLSFQTAESLANARYLSKSFFMFANLRKT